MKSNPGGSSRVRTAYQTLWNELFAAASLAALIPLLILLPLQRFYVQGVTAGGFK